MNRTHYIYSAKGLGFIFLIYKMNAWEKSAYKVSVKKKNLKERDH
jgi:hypothetical protein